MFAKHTREFIRAKPDVIFYIDSPDISQLERQQKEAAQSNIPGEWSVSAKDHGNPVSPLSFSYSRTDRNLSDNNLTSFLSLLVTDIVIDCTQLYSARDKQ